MKIRNLIITLIAGTACNFGISAQDGGNAYNFLNIPVSSRVYGLGGHNITVIDDDINLIEQNPALLGPEFDKQIGINYMHYIGGSNFMGVRYGNGISDHNAWAIGIQYYGYGDFTAADIDGTITGSFSASDIAFSASYSHDINDRLRGGITVKALSSKYEDYSAFALCTDLGLNYYNPDNEISMSVVLKNLGGQLTKFNEEYDRLPWDIQLGYSQFLKNTSIRISITATNLTKWELPYYTREDQSSTSSPLVEKNSFSSNFFRHLTFAAEYVPSDKFYVGLGYNHKTRTDMSTYSRNFLSGFSIGAGIKTSSIGVGIALSQPHTGATTFMANFTMSLASLLR
ncbi:MAG: type IX secretion system protein PorQ [Bacteroidales bacterium]|nr:type IX secretion system protein PorQ [Bacteroidales bacterium]